MKKIIVTSLVFFLILFLWEWGSQSHSHLRFVIPPPSSIATTLWHQAFLLLGHTGATLKIMICGLLLALAWALPLAWAMSLSPQTSAILQPAFVMLKCIPMFTLAPIMVIWFDWSFTSLVLPTALAIFFPLTLSIFQGLRATPPQLISFFRVNNATQWQLFFKLQLPYALPHIFGGLRIAAALAGISAIAGEWAGAQNGLGVLMLESRHNTDLAMTFAALCCLVALSLCFYVLVVAAEALALSWRRQWSRVLTAVSCAFAILMGSALAWPSPAVQSIAAGTPTIRLMLDWLPNPNHIPLYVAIDKGFFAEEGLHISLHKIHDPSDPIPSVTSGITDLAISYMPSTMRAMAMGADLKIIATLIAEPLNCVLYRTDGGIAAHQDLNQKSIGYCTGSKGAQALHTILTFNRIAPSDTRNVNFDLISTLATGKVDAIYGACWNIETAQLESLGIPTAYFSLEQLGVPPYDELIVIANGTSPASTKIFKTAFQSALQRSIDFCRDNPDEAFDIYRKANPDKSAPTFHWERNAWALTLPTLAKSQEMSPSAMHKFAHWLLEHNLITQPVDVSLLLSEGES